MSPTIGRSLRGSRMASVLEGFLVSLGFDVDKDQLAKFNETIHAAGERFVSLSKKGLAAGAAMGAAFLKASDSVNDLYKISNNTGASIKGIQTLQGAVERVGGSAENVTAAVQEFALKSKTFGAGFEQMVRTQVGVSMRDAQGNARDMANVLADVSRELARMAKTDPGMARMKAEALGLGGIFDDIVKKDFPRELERSAKMAGVFGDQIDQTANASHRLMNEVSQVWDTVSNGAMAAAGQITEALDLDDKLANFNDHFADWLSDIVNSQLNLIKKATGIFDWFGSLFTDSGDALDDAKIERLEKKAKSGKASKEDREELDALKKEREENRTADRLHIDRDAARDMGIHEKMDDEVALKAKVFGVDDDDLKDPKARKELEERRITSEDLAQLADGDNADANAFMLALELKKRQDARDAEKPKEEKVRDVVRETTRETRETNNFETVKESKDAAPSDGTAPTVVVQAPQLKPQLIPQSQREIYSTPDAVKELIYQTSRETNNTETIKEVPVPADLPNAKPQRDAEGKIELDIPKQVMQPAMTSLMEAPPATVEDGPSYFEAPAWTRDVPQNVDNSTSTNVSDDHRSATTTVNQTIMISGGSDPTAIGQAVAQETQKTIARNSKRSLV